MLERALAPLFSSGQEAGRLYNARVLWSSMHGICSLVRYTATDDGHRRLNVPYPGVFDVLEKRYRRSQMWPVRRQHEPSSRFHFRLWRPELAEGATSRHSESLATVSTCRSKTDMIESVWSAVTCNLDPDQCAPEHGRGAGCCGVWLISHRGATDLTIRPAPQILPPCFFSAGGVPTP